MLGLNPVHWYIHAFYITSTTTGHDGSVVSALASQAKGRGSIPSYGTSSFSHNIFYLPFPTSLGK